MRGYKHGGRRSIRSIVRSLDRVDRFDRFDNFSFVRNFFKFSLASARFKRSKNHQNPSHPRQNSGRKNSDEKNGGQGTGARHGRCGGKARVTEIPGGRSPPDPPWGQGMGNGDFWGAKAPPDPPTTPFQKICPSGANFLK